MTSTTEYDEGRASRYAPMLWREGEPRQDLAVRPAHPIRPAIRNINLTAAALDFFAAGFNLNAALGGSVVAWFCVALTICAGIYMIVQGVSIHQTEQKQAA